MKITDVRSFIVHTGRRNCQFVTVHTADGRYGVGEARLSGREKAVLIEGIAGAIKQ